MHERNRLFAAIALACGLPGGRLGLVHRAAPSAVAGKAPQVHAHMLQRFTGNPNAMAPWTWVELGAASELR